MGNPNPAYAGDLESHRGLTQLDEAGAAGALQDPAGDLAARGQASELLAAEDELRADGGLTLKQRALIIDGVNQNHRSVCARDAALEETLRAELLKVSPECLPTLQTARRDASQGVNHPAEIGALIVSLPSLPEGEFDAALDRINALTRDHALALSNYELWGRGYIAALTQLQDEMTLLNARVTEQPQRVAAALPSLCEAVVQHEIGRRAQQALRGGEALMADYQTGQITFERHTSGNVLLHVQRAAEIEAHVRAEVEPRWYLEAAAIEYAVAASKAQLDLGALSKKEREAVLNQAQLAGLFEDHHTWKALYDGAIDALDRTQPSSPKLVQLKRDRARLDREFGREILKRCDVKVARTTQEQIKAIMTAARGRYTLIEVMGEKKQIGVDNIFRFLNKQRTQLSPKERALLDDADILWGKADIALGFIQHVVDVGLIASKIAQGTSHVSGSADPMVEGLAHAVGLAGRLPLFGKYFNGMKQMLNHIAESVGALRQAKLRWSLQAEQIQAMMLE